MRFFRKPFVPAVCLGAVLLLFTGFVLLDTFVIPHAHTVVTPQTDTDGTTTRFVDTATLPPLDTLSTTPTAPTTMTEVIIPVTNDGGETVTDAEGVAVTEIVPVPTEIVTVTEAGGTPVTMTNAAGATEYVTQIVTAPTTTTTGTTSPGATTTSRRGETTTTTKAPVTTTTVPTQPISSDTMYRDSHIAITLRQLRAYDSDIYVADVLLTSPNYLKTAFAKNTFGQNIKVKTSETAQAMGALLAVNGDFYGSRATGYVIREGILYRDTKSDDAQEDLVIYGDGSMDVIREGDISAATLLTNGARQVLSFGPGLLDQGVLTGDGLTTVEVSNPRTAIGILAPNHYTFVVVDGRTDQSIGLTMAQLAEFMQSLGCTTAYNLDGGGSSSLYFNGKLINNPTADGSDFHERRVSDIVYIGY